MAPPLKLNDVRYRYIRAAFEDVERVTYHSNIVLAQCSHAVISLSCQCNTFNQSKFLLIRIVRVFATTFDWLSGSNLLAALLTFFSTYFHSHGEIAIYHSITSLIRVRLTRIMYDVVVSVFLSFDCFEIDCRILLLDKKRRRWWLHPQIRGIRIAKQITCNTHTHGNELRLSRQCWHVNLV